MHPVLNVTRETNDIIITGTTSNRASIDRMIELLTRSSDGVEPVSSFPNVLDIGILRVSGSP